MSVPITTTGLVLKEQPIGEAGKLITILTPELGVVKGFAHGSRKSSSRLLAGCSLFSYSRFVPAISFSTASSTSLPATPAAVTSFSMGIESGSAINQVATDQAQTMPPNEYI